MQFKANTRGLLSKGVVLLHDNDSPHTATHTAESLQKLKFDVMGHALNSTDVDPPLKEALRGCRFILDQEVKDVVQA
jgi:hypothetical protein